MNVFKNSKKPIVLIVLDGLGAADPNAGNAVTLANTPNLDALWPRFSHTYLQASGNYVGLPTGVTGNSEVGHMSIGAGRVVFQEIAKIDHEIETGDFYENEMLLKVINHLKTNKSRLHLMGVLSDGNVHASIDHLFALLEFGKRNGLNQKNTFIHAFTDGRDTPPQNAKEYFERLEAKANSLGVGKIASVIGRYFAMDRDNRWERTQKAYDLIVEGVGTQVSKWNDALDAAYAANTNDEFLEPYVITENGAPVAKVEDNDVILFYNYRGDRAVQISHAFEDSNFPHFKRRELNNVLFVGFSNYEKGVVMNRAKSDVEEAGDESKMIDKMMKDELEQEGFPANQVFPPSRINDSLGWAIAEAGLSQLRLAESEKYPHVTYFLNCRINDPYEREDRIEIPSPREVATYDLKPEMSAYEITTEFIKQVDSGKYDFIFVNYALTDMVAHTGNLEASIKCVEVADECMGVVVKKTMDAGGEVLITADHGNVEELLNLVTGEMDTKHSVNPVPFIHVNKEGTKRELQFGMLADLAPTVLALLGIDTPEGMTGRNLTR